jgi:hypothetical protein
MGIDPTPIYRGGQANPKTIVNGCGYDNLIHQSTRFGTAVASETQPPYQFLAFARAAGCR